MLTERTGADEWRIAADQRLLPRRTVLAQSEDEFLDLLEKIFRAKKTAQIITGLLVQANAEGSRIIPF